MNDHLARTEQQKYETMWRCPEYRKTSSGFDVAPLFLAYFQGQLEEGDSILDMGCGRGVTSCLFFLQGFRVHMVDIASNCLDATTQSMIEVSRKRMTYLVAPLWNLPNTLPVADWVYCSDVLEHLPEPQIDTALEQMAVRTRKGAFFQIFLEEEKFGALIGATLHLTIRPHSWWLEKLQRHWTILDHFVDASGCRCCVFLAPKSAS